MPFTYDELCILIDALHDKIQWWDNQYKSMPTMAALNELNTLEPLLSRLESMADEFKP